jgi:hypothetical protein
MTEPNPLQALWAADEPPARDVAFTAAVLGRLTAKDRRRAAVLHGLRGVGVGAGVCGVTVLMTAASLDPWLLATIASALGAGLWAGRGLFLDA